MVYYHGHSWKIMLTNEQPSQRLKEMKQMQRDPLASSKARKAERKADEKSGLITIKPLKLDGSSSTGTGSGFKKGGFKSAFGSVPADNTGGDGSSTTDKLSTGAVSGKFAGAGFKKIADSTGEDGDGAVKTVQEDGKQQQSRLAAGDEDEESDTEDEGYEMYDPRHPTD